MAISGNLRVVFDLSHTKTEASTFFENFNPIDYVVSSGTGISSMDLLFSDRRTLAASASEDLDVSGGLTNSFGDACTFVDIRMICIVASSANTNNVLVGGAAANQLINWVGNASDIVVVKPAGCLFLYTPTDPGYAVTAGTGDLLKIANSGGTTGVTYDIYIGGTSA